jgi:glycerol-3-phosphate acyltransferase PlsY
VPGEAPHADFLLPLATVAVVGYLLGALPFGYLVARSRGVDIFKVGSGNPGATNVRRTLGAGAGNTVFVLDALKGSAAVGWPLVVSWEALRSLGEPSVFGYVGLGFALLGHSYSCFTRFRGGKGVATGAGGLVVLLPYVGLAALALWVGVLYASRYVSLASLVAAASLPFLSVALHGSRLALWVTTAIAVFVVVRHRANIGRLLSGTEKRFDRNKAAPKDAARNP